MNILYRIYQIFIAAPLLLLITVLTTLFTTIGSTIGSAHFWGYWPGHLWGRWFMRILLLQDTTWAVHWFNREFFIINLGGIHVLFIVSPVTTGNPKFFT